jgi:hypothetical protein
LATPYSKIYDRFGQKIIDFDLAEMHDYSLNEMLLGWLETAIVRTRKCDHDLSLRDDETEEFQEDLTALEVELLALGMVDAWIGQSLNSTENIRQFIGGKEEKYYSQAAHISALLSIRDEVKKEMKSLHNYHTYTNSAYFNV